MCERKKDKILMVSIGALDHGGVQAVLMSTVRALSNQYQFDVIVFSDKESFYDKEFVSKGGCIFRLPRYEGMSIIKHKLDALLFNLVSYQKIFHLIKDNGPYQAIHCHNDFGSSIFISIAKRLRIPIRIIHSHVVTDLGKGHYPRKISNWISWNGFKNATARIGCSQEACVSLFRNLSYEIVRNPYDETKFNKTLFPECKAKSFIITQVGSYSDNKNQLFTIDVLHYIKQRYPDCIVRFVGFELEKGYLNAVVNKVKALHLEDNVEFYPDNVNIAEILSTSSYFIFPSKIEGFGIVLIEAQAMGLTCFVSESVPKSTDCGGCRYLPLNNKMADLWANAICSSYELDLGKHKDYDCSKFSTVRYSEIIKKLYQGDQHD